jgi:type IV secretory pathway TrbF-like protein
VFVAAAEPSGYACSLELGNDGSVRVGETMPAAFGDTPGCFFTINSNVIAFNSTISDISFQFRVTSSTLVGYTLRSDTTAQIFSVEPVAATYQSGNAPTRQLLGRFVKKVSNLGYWF